jgi:transposase InsO family protein
VEAVGEAVARYGKPEIFNTDQGSQFTSIAFTGLLLKNEIKISMDGKGAWRDNIFVERLWRTIKYEEVYLRAYASVPEARASIGRIYRRLLQTGAAAIADNALSNLVTTNETCDYEAWRAQIRSQIAGLTARSACSTGTWTA